ncbi:MAG: ATP synthase subunit I [Myxococcota bacterium]
MLELDRFARASGSFDRITVQIALFGTVLTAAAFALLGPKISFGALVGTIVSVANWILLRFLVSRISTASDASRFSIAGLLGFKMTFLIFLSWVLIRDAGVDPVGYLVGTGSFALGIFFGAGSPSEPERAACPEHAAHPEEAIDSSRPSKDFLDPHESHLLRENAVSEHLSSSGVHATTTDRTPGEQ